MKDNNILVIKCKECGTKIEVDKSEYPVGKEVSTICPLCGETVSFVIPRPKQDQPTVVPKEKVKPQSQTCPKCNQKIPIDSVFCPKCGYSLEKNEYNLEQKNSRNNPLKEQPNGHETQKKDLQYQEKSSTNLKLVFGVLVGFIGAIIVVIFLVSVLNKNTNQDSIAKESVSSHETVETNTSTTDHTYTEPTKTSSSNQHTPTTTQIEVSTYSQDESRYDFVCARYVSDSDLIGLSKKELRIMRNWIYARHGYIFNSQDLREYFGRMSWYSPRYSDVSSKLSELEINNVYKIKSYE